MRENVLDEDGLRSEHHIGNDAVLVAAYVENHKAADPVHRVEHRLQRREISGLCVFQRRVPMKQGVGGPGMDQPELTQRSLGDDVHGKLSQKQIKIAITDMARRERGARTVGRSELMGELRS